jgi:hypothetical protein
MDFTILATQLKEIKLLTNMSSATKEYIWQTAASLENKTNDILQQQQILNDWEEQCRYVSKRIENQRKSIQLHDQIRESQWETILAYVCCGGEGVLAWNSEAGSFFSSRTKHLLQTRLSKPNPPEPK